MSDARDIVDELTQRGVKLNIGGSVHDPTDPIGRLLFNVLAMIAGRRRLAAAVAAAESGRRQRDIIAAALNVSQPAVAQLLSRARR